MVDQGDVITLPGIKEPLLVVSKNSYNNSGKAVLCQIFTNSNNNQLEEKIEWEKKCGYVHCDNLKQFDIEARGFCKKGQISLIKRMIISDKIQSIFDYV